MVKTFEAKKGKWVSNFLKIEKYEVAIRFPLYFLMGRGGGKMSMDAVQRNKIFIEENERLKFKYTL